MNPEVPYVNLVAQHAEMKSELLAAFERVLQHGTFILGDEVAQFENQIAAYCGTRFAIGVNSGTDALSLVLKAWGIGPGDEVITAPNSFLASASSIAAIGARPVFADIGADLNIDPQQVRKAITPRTRAIMPVHLSGKPAAMDEILDVAQQHHLKVVEDAAQAIGTKYRGKMTGSLGDAGCFSLHPLKTLNACGDAGIITTNDESLYQSLLQMRNIGLKNRDETDHWGVNSRLDTVQAAFLMVKLRYLDSWILARRENARFYDEALRGVVDLPQEEAHEFCSYHTYVIRTPRRNELQNFLSDRKTGTKIHYPIPIHLQKAARDLGYKPGDFPVTELYSQQILSLPVYQGMTRDQLAWVAQSIREFFKKGV